MTTEQIFRLISPIITLLISVLIKHYTERRPRLISFLGHISTFNLSGEHKSQIYAHSVVIRNAGNKSAQNVRLGHNFLPPNITVYPRVQYLIERNDDNSGEIIFPVLVPKEQITISYLYFPPVTWDLINTYTKSDDGLAKIIKVIPMAPPAKWLTILAGILIFIGSSLSIYWLLHLIVNLI